MTTSNTHTNQQEIPPLVTNTLSGVYAFLMERRLERKVAAKVTDTQAPVLTMPPDKAEESLNP